MFDLHVEGGMEFMLPLSVLFMVNLGVFAFVVFERLTKNVVNDTRLDIIRHLGMLALAFGVFGTVTGLMQAFGALSEIKETLPFYVIMGGLKVAMINVVYGLIIFLVSMLMVLVLRFFAKPQVR
jgi:biopolymer transport protein ExbB/TolQ